MTTQHSHLLDAASAHPRPWRTASRCRLSLAALTVVLPLFAIYWSLGPIFAQSDPAAPQATTLRPGHNWVGWVAHPLDVAVLHARLPEVVSVSAWDPLSGRSYTPKRLTAGMGLRITVESAGPISWQRSHAPIRGGVALSAGRNLVAWGGARTPIETAVRGLGAALVRAWTPDRAGILERGSTLWVEVRRPVHWLQPTETPPALHFPGGASAELAAAVRRDLEEIVAFSRDLFGVEVDFSLTDIYAARDVESYIAERGLTGEEAEEARGLWFGAAGWATQGVVAIVKLQSWAAGTEQADGATGAHTEGRYVLAHEYFHLLQHQLSGGIDDAPAWLIEGGATWFEWLLREQDLKGEQRDWTSRPGFTTVFDQAPALEQLERTTDSGFEYELGAQALRLLVAEHGLEGPVEFWRALLPMPLGPHARWVPQRDWRQAFSDVFAFTAQQFYRQVGLWRQAAEDNGLGVRLVGPQGEPLAGIGVSLTASVAGAELHRWIERQTDRDGWAKMPLHADVVSYLVGIKLGDCRIYAARSGVAFNERAARRFAAVGEPPDSLTIRVPADACTWRLSGRVIDSAGSGLAGMQVEMLSERASASSVTEADGSYSLTAPRAGRYRVALQPKPGCALYWTEDGLIGDPHRAQYIDLSRGDLASLEIRVADGSCSLAISGRIVSADGSSYSGDYVAAIGEDIVVQGAIDQDGDFSVIVPTPGSYRLLFEYEGCQLYYRSGGVTPHRESAEPIGVESSSTVAGTIRIPATLCAVVVTGELVNSAGQPLAGWFVSAYVGGDLGASVTTDAQGRFSLRIPTAGSYVFAADRDWCNYFYAGDGPLKSTPGPAIPLAVAQTGITDLVFRLPTSAPASCN